MLLRVRLFVLCAVTGLALSFPDGRSLAQLHQERKLYDNDELFHQLSGAYRSKLERMFGRKSVGQDGKAAGPRYSDGGGIRLETIMGTGPLAALANVLVNNAAADATSQDTQSETALVIGSGSNVICGFNDSGSHVPTTNNHFTGWSWSSDGAASWTDGGLLPNSVTGDAGDPVLARSSATGTVFLSTLGYTNGNTLQIFRSANDGRSWGAPVSGSPGQPSGSQDKEWIAVDNFPGSGYGTVYMFWRNFGTPSGMNFSRSMDDGVTWTVTQAPLATGGQGAYVTVGTDHAVYCFWLSGTSIVVRKSSDVGVTFAPAVTVTTLLTTGVNGDLGLGFRSNAFPHAAVNPLNGNLYVVYNDNPAGADRGNVYFRQSTDGGATWGAQLLLNDDGGTNDQWQPTLAVTPDGTALCVTWYDRRSDPANSLIERWGVIGTISGSTVTFGPSFRVGSAFPAVYGVDPVVNSVYMGDYDQMAADNSFFYTVWGDNRDQSIAVPSRKNANVRAAKIPKAGPGVILDYMSTVVTGGNGNGKVDYNECDTLRITVKNNGSSPATGVIGTLTTTTSDVVVLESSVSYPDLSPGTYAGALFRISTSPAFACGTPIAFTLTLTSSGGSDVSLFSLPTGGSDYAITSSTGATIVAGTADVGNHGDDVVTAVSLPFSYSFYGATYTSVNVSSNGNLQFSSTNNDYANACLPTGSFTDAILPHWDDLRTDGVGSGIFTSVTGSAPNRIFNIEWRAAYFSSGASLNFEVRLYEGISTFDVIYGTLNGTGASATVGVQKGTGASVTQHSCNQGVLSSGLKLTFALTPCSDGGGECTPLPIQLARFSGTRVGAHAVRLDWTTLTELNNYGFEVQKAADAPENFVTIPGSFVPGHGTTNEPRHYTYTDNAARGRVLFYRLKQIDLDGSVHYTEAIGIDMLTEVSTGDIPSEFSLAQNYPNPFNSTTHFGFGIADFGLVSLEVYDVLGREVAALVNEVKPPGSYTVQWDAGGCPSGVYYYRLQAGDFIASKKLLLLK